MTYLIKAILAALTIVLFSVPVEAHDWHRPHYHNWWWNHPRVILRFQLPPPPVYYVPVVPGRNYIPPQPQQNIEPRVRVLEERMDKKDEMDNSQNKSIEEVKAILRRNGKLSSEVSSVSSWYSSKIFTLVGGIFGAIMLGVIGTNIYYGWRNKKKTAEKPHDTESELRPNLAGDPQVDEPRIKPQLRRTLSDSRDIPVPGASEGSVARFGPAPDHSDGRKRFQSPWTGNPILESSLSSHAEEWFKKTGKVPK